MGTSRSPLPIASHARLLAPEFVEEGRGGEGAAKNQCDEGEGAKPNQRADGLGHKEEA